MSLLKSHTTPPTSWTLDGGEEVPEQFSDSTEEVEQLNNRVALMDFSHRGVVEISGPQRSDFLQGLTTNQIKDITDNRSVYSAILSPQGRFLWDFTVCQSQERFFLEVEPQQEKKLVDALSFYLMRTKATITDVSSQYGVVAIAGPKATEAVSQLFPDLPIGEADLGATFMVYETAQLWRDPRHGDFGWRLRVPKDDFLEIWDRVAKNIPPAGQVAWESYRINRGLPRGGAEFIPDKSIPLESGLLEMNGVSFQKGCFVGQETTARTHHRGTLKKRLFQVILEGNGLVPVETPILTPSEKEAGVLTSVTCQNGQCQGLALLRTSDVVDDKQLTILGRKLTAQKPTWASWD
jgi:tRNA-modifying protein YgfZ